MKSKTSQFDQVICISEIKCIDFIFEVGKKYKYRSKDSKTNIHNTIYSVYSGIGEDELTFYNNKLGSGTHLWPALHTFSDIVDYGKIQFDKHFITLSDYRDKRLNQLL